MGHMTNIGVFERTTVRSGGGNFRRPDGRALLAVFEEEAGRAETMIRTRPFFELSGTGDTHGPAGLFDNTAIYAFGIELSLGVCVKPVYGDGEKGKPDCEGDEEPPPQNSSGNKNHVRLHRFPTADFRRAQRSRHLPY